MTVLCPRCGENSSVLDEHCKKCGFSIKNYLDNKKRFNIAYNQDSKISESNKKESIENTFSGSSSICVMEKQNDSNHNKTTGESICSNEDSKIENMESNTDNSDQVMNMFDNKSDEIQENILRIIGNIKIVPEKEEHSKRDNVDNKIIEKNVQDVLEEIIYNNFDKDVDDKKDNASVKEEKTISNKDTNIKNESNSLEKTSKNNKKEPVKIIAKKVADDVIILPPNRVKVEIEAAKDVVREEKNEDKPKHKLNEDTNANKDDKIEVLKESELNADEKKSEEVKLVNTNEQKKDPLLIENKKDDATKEIADEVIENKIKEIKNNLANKKENLIKKTEIIKDELEGKEEEELEIINGAVNYVKNNKFHDFVSNIRSEDDEAVKAIVIISIFILVLVLIIMLITSTATASQLLGIISNLLF